jgi:hypothetical protein
LFALQLEEWQVLVDIRYATDFANWSKNKDGWDTLEEHCDPSRCAGVTMKSGTITEIELSSSNLNGGEFSLAHMPRCRITSDVTSYFASTF